METEHKEQAPETSTLVNPRRVFFSWRFIRMALLFAVLASAIAMSLGLAPTGVAEAGNAVVTFFFPQNPDPALIIPGVTYIDVPEGPRVPKIIVPDVGISAKILFPTSTDINDLNNELTKGVVHYPGSAMPGENGTAFFFGHSTGLKVVHNKNFEVFNRLHELASNDIIRIQNNDREYWYRVVSISVKKADEAWVDLGQTDEKKLVLSTCKIFGAKEDRYIVDADFVKSYPLRITRAAAGTSS